MQLAKKSGGSTRSIDALADRSGATRPAMLYTGVLLLWWMFHPLRFGEGE